MSRKKKKAGKRVHLTPAQIMEKQSREKQAAALAAAFTSLASDEPDKSIVACGKTRQVEAVKPVRKFPDAELPKDDALLLTVADVCRLLKISRVTLYRIEKDNPLPGRVKIGGQVRYHRESLEKWLLKQCDNQ